MKKQKYLYRIGYGYKSDYSYNRVKYNYVDIENQPKKFKIRSKSKYRNLDQLPQTERIKHKHEFLKDYLYPYLETKIGQYWNDIYTDIISKTKPKHRFLIDREIDWNISLNVFYEDFIPYSNYTFHGVREIRNYGLYVDRDGLIQKYNKEEYRRNIRALKRKLKLDNILNKINEL